MTEIQIMEVFPETEQTLIRYSNDLNSSHFWIFSSDIFLYEKCLTYFDSLLFSFHFLQLSILLLLHSLF